MTPLKPGNHGYHLLNFGITHLSILLWDALLSKPYMAMTLTWVCYLLQLRQPQFQ